MKTRILTPASYAKEQRDFGLCLACDDSWGETNFFADVVHCVTEEEVRWFRLIGPNGIECLIHAKYVLNITYLPEPERSGGGSTSFRGSNIPTWAALKALEEGVFGEHQTPNPFPNRSPLESRVRAFLKSSFPG